MKKRTNRIQRPASVHRWQRDEKLTELSSQTGNKIDYDELSIQEIEKLFSLSDENGNMAFYVDKEGYLRAKTKESEAIERLTNNEIENEDGKFPFSFSDEKGNILFYLDYNGFFHANNEKKFEAENGKYLLSFSDENGNMAFYVDENGYFHVKSKLFGKRLSILADSISTFKGYLADEEYQHYYWHELKHSLLRLVGRRHWRYAHLYVCEKRIYKRQNVQRKSKYARAERQRIRQGKIVHPQEVRKTYLAGSLQHVI